MGFYLFFLNVNNHFVFPFMLYKMEISPKSKYWLKILKLSTIILVMYDVGEKGRIAQNSNR